jgi:hypothetical protein
MVRTDEKWWNEVSESRMRTDGANEVHELR